MQSITNYVFNIKGLKSINLHLKKKGFTSFPNVGEHNRLFEFFFFVIP